MEGVKKLGIKPISKERLGNLGASLSNLKIKKDEFNKFNEMPNNNVERMKAVAVALVSSLMWYDIDDKNTEYSVFKSRVGGVFIDNDCDIEHEVWKFPVNSNDIDNAIRILEKNGYVVGYKRSDAFCCIMPAFLNTEEQYEIFHLYDYDDITDGLRSLEKYRRFRVYVREDYVPEKYREKCELTTDVSSERMFRYPLMDIHGKTIYYAKLCWEESDYGGHWYILMDKREHLDWVKVDINEFQKQNPRNI